MELQRHGLWLVVVTLLVSCAAKETLNPVAVYGSVEKSKICLDRIWNYAIQALTVQVRGTCLRYAFHDAGTYDKDTDDGGANGSIVRELGDNHNVGLDKCAPFIGDILDNVTSSDPCTDTTVADIVQVTGAVAVYASGGPACPQFMGRRDRPRDDNRGKDDGVKLLPNACSNISTLIAGFAQNGFKDPARSLVVLSGAHNIGQQRSPISVSSSCSKGVGPLSSTNTVFDNGYYRLINAPRNDSDPANGKGHFHSDNELVNGGNDATKAQVQLYASNSAAFLADWCVHYNEMSLLGVEVPDSFLPISDDWLPAHMPPRPGVLSPPATSPSPSPPAASPSPPPDAASPPSPGPPHPPSPVAASPPPPVATSPSPSPSPSPPKSPAPARPRYPTDASPPPPVASPSPSPVASSPPPPVASPNPSPVLSSPPPSNVPPTVTYKTVRDAINSAHYSTMARLLSYANSNDKDIKNLLRSKSFTAVILIPGNGPNAKAMFAHLDALKKNKKTARLVKDWAKYIISYHVLLSKAKPPKPPQAWTIKSFKYTVDYRTALVSSPSLYRNTVREVSLKALDSASSTVYAGGIATGATFTLTGSVVAANARVYACSDMLLPPSYTLSYPPSIKGPGSWRFPLSVMSGLSAVAASKTSLAPGAGKKEGSVFYSLLFAVDVDLQETLSKSSTAYTIFVPTNAAIRSYLNKRFLQLKGFKQNLLRHHIITSRPLKRSDFYSSGSSVTYPTYSKSSGSLIIQGVRSSPKKPVTLIEICLKTKKGPRSRAIQIVKSDIIAGKSVIHYINNVLDLCEN